MPGALGRGPQDVVHEVRVHSGTSHEQALQLRLDLAQEAAGVGSARVALGRAEHAQQPAVIGARGVHLVAALLAPVVLAQRACVLSERLDDVAVEPGRPASLEVAHRSVHVL